MNGRLQYRLAAALGLMAILLGSASCGDMVRQGKSPSFLVIDALTGASANTPGSFGGTLQSDVVRLVKPTDPAIPGTVKTYFEDLGKVALRLLLKDPGNGGVVAAPTALNSITVTRYHVAYRRSDGRNIQGVDVPYAFDGAVTATVGTSSTEVTFTIVRIQAKLEPPLSTMAGAGGSIAISTIADVTFYGHDQAGNDVSQTGSISVNFADWADPSS